MKTKLIFLPVMLLLLSGCIYESIDGRTGGEDIDVLSTRLLAYYTFDNGTLEDNSKNSYDAAFLGNNGEYINDTPSNSGKALSLNAFKKQFINIPYNLLIGKPSFSICFWIKDFSAGYLFATSDRNRMRSISVTEDGFFRIKGYNGTTTSYDATKIMAGEWHHVVFASGEGKVSVYVDGSLKDTKDWDDRGADEGATSTQVGAGTFADGYTTNMKIDNIRIYYEKVSGDKVSKIYNYEK